MEAAFSLESWFEYNQKETVPHFATFYRSCFPPLSKYAATIITDRHQVTELVSDVIWRAWQYREKWKTPASFRAFMFSSVRNAVYNNLSQLRRQEKRKKVFRAAGEPVDDRNVLNRIVHKELMDHLFQAAAHLPGQCAKVFSLYYREGLNHDEIALQLSIAPSTVRNQKARALRLLREKINNSPLF